MIEKITSLGLVESRQICHGIFFILTAVQIDARALFCHSTLTKAVTLTSHKGTDNVGYILT